MSIGDLGNMDKTVDAGDDPCKCAEGGETDDLSLDHAAYGIILPEDLPGIVLVSSVAERDLLILSVESLDVNVNFLTDAEYFGGILDTLPGHLGDMYHTVNAADIDECAVVGH